MYVPNQVEPVRRSTNTESSSYHAAGTNGGIAPSSIEGSGFFEELLNFATTFAQPIFGQLGI